MTNKEIGAKIAGAVEFKEELLTYGLDSSEKRWGQPFWKFPNEAMILQGRWDPAENRDDLWLVLNSMSSIHFEDIFSEIRNNVKYKDILDDSLQCTSSKCTVFNYAWKNPEQVFDAICNVYRKMNE